MLSRLLDSGRRRFLIRFALLFGAAFVLPMRSRAAPSVGGKSDAIRQPVPADQDGFMRRARAMRQRAVETGDQAYGAVVVRYGQIVGQAPSRVIVRGDPTAHAEMEAIRDAARRLGTQDLSGCEIVSTSKPCRMCETASYWAGIERMRYGAQISDGGAPRYSAC